MVFTPIRQIRFMQNYKWKFLQYVYTYSISIKNLKKLWFYNWQNINCTIYKKNYSNTSIEIVDDSIDGFGKELIKEPHQRLLLLVVSVFTALTINYSRCINESFHSGNHLAVREQFGTYSQRDFLHSYVIQKTTWPSKNKWACVLFSVFTAWSLAFYTPQWLDWPSYVQMSISVCSQCDILRSYIP